MLQQFGASIWPTDAVTTVTGGVTSAITDNIGVILGVLAFFLGLGFIMRMFNRSKKGHL
jgi:hypothetical protein